MIRKILNTNYFELGALRGVLGKNFERLPEKLQLKLNILFTEAYLGSAMDRQARRDLKMYKLRLKKLI